VIVKYCSIVPLKTGHSHKRPSLLSGQIERCTVIVKYCTVVPLKTGHFFITEGVDL